MGRPWGMSCDKHGKMAFDSRARAKRHIRMLGDSGMRPYRCDAIDGYWHIGHLPLAVKQGKATAAEVYGGER